MKKHFKKIIFGVIFFSGFLVWQNALAAEYYVKNGGNDNAAGTSDETAWATVAKVESIVTSGDTVYFRSQDTWEASGRTQVIEAKTGVTYDGSSYGNGTRAIFKGTQGSSGANRGIVGINKSNIKFVGFEINGNDQRLDGITIGYNTATAISNIIIDNVIVHDNGPKAPANPEYYGYGLLVASTAGIGTVISNVTIQNSQFYNNGGEGIAIYQSRLYPNNRTNGVTIRNCIVHDTGLSNINFLGNGILIANDSDNVTVEFNTLYNTSLGIWIRTSPIYEIAEGNGAPNNMIVRHNIIYDSYSSGISISNPQGANVSAPVSMSGDFYGNLIFNTAGDCSVPYYKDGWELSVGEYHWNNTYFNFYNNTFFNTRNECTNSAGIVNFAIWGADGWQLTGAMNFKNNILYSNNNGSHWSNYANLWDATNGGVNYSNNLIYRSSGASDHHVFMKYPSPIFYDRAGGAADLLLHWDSTAQETDPLFIGGTLPTGFTGTYGTDMVPNTNYFQLTNDSPAKDNGATLGSPFNLSINSAGLANTFLRPQGAAYDIGAYEYASETTDTTPPAAPSGLAVN